MNFTLALKQHYDDLTDSERDIASYLYSHTAEVKKMGIIQVAESTLVSKSTVLRFSQKLGYSGFSEMKRHLVDLDNQQRENQGNSNLIKKLKDEEQNFFDYLEKINFEKLTEVVNHSKRIYLYATGTTQQAYVQVFYSQLLLLKLPVNLVFGQSSLEAILPSIGPSDSVIIASYGGETEHIKEPMRIISVAGAVVISITSFGKNFLVNHANYSLFYEGTPLNSYDISLVQLAQLLDFFVRQLQVN